MKAKPSIPKGTRDFSPQEMLQRDFIFDTIKKVFRLYGYQPIETPAMENLSTLLGKYGEEGDKLLFRILNSGDFLSGLNEKEFSNPDSGKISSKICEKGLRYDLTVPFARYIVQHSDEIIFPFKRYQIQPVWRADRPQKGRYREFFQCDVDVIGSDSLVNEYELIRIIDEVFSRLKIAAVIKLNNRKILSGIASVIGESEKITDITVIIDKIDKIGAETVSEELRLKGISDHAILKIHQILQLKGDTKTKLDQLESILSASEEGLQGIYELRQLFTFIGSTELKCVVELDLTLARGLNYYTGAIIEVKAKDVSIGSICGGGRYDNLAGIFGLEGVSGVGVSFGADRIYDVLNHLKRFDDVKYSGTKIMIINFGESSLEYCLKILDTLHELGIESEFYPESVKMKKQMAYADAKRIPFVILAGEDEIKNNEVTVRNMETGEQNKVNPGDLKLFLSGKTGIIP